MNIDLFLTKHGEGGLLCDSPFEYDVQGMILDAQTCALTVEFGEEDDPLHLNIPVENDYIEGLLFSHRMYIGVLSDGLIADTLQVPMRYLHDPYGGGFDALSPVGRAGRSMIGFEQFMKRSTHAQPIHRDNLEDESLSGCVLRGMDRKALEYVPQLVKARMLEAAPRMKGPSPGLHVAPDMPRMSAPGLTPPGAGGGRAQTRRIIPRPPVRDEDEE